MSSKAGIPGHAAAGHKPVVFGTQNARGVLPLSPCEERAGRESERGETDKKRLLSPALSSFFEEERERKPGCALKANLRPNTTHAEQNWSQTSQTRAPRISWPPVWIAPHKTGALDR